MSYDKTAFQNGPVYNKKEPFVKKKTADKKETGQRFLFVLRGKSVGSQWSFREIYAKSRIKIQT